MNGAMMDRRGAKAALQKLKRRVAGRAAPESPRSVMAPIVCWYPFRAGAVQEPLTSPLQLTASEVFDTRVEVVEGVEGFEPDLSVRDGRALPVLISCCRANIEFRCRGP